MTMSSTTRTTSFLAMLLLVAPLLAANLRNGLVSDRLQMGGGQAEDTHHLRQLNTPKDGQQLQTNVHHRSLGNEIFSYIGCTSDDWDQRLLNASASSPEMTTQVCYDLCARKDASVMGLALGDLCWCGSDDLAAMGKVQHEKKCFSPCGGDPGMVCVKSNTRGSTASPPSSSPTSTQAPAPMIVGKTAKTLVADTTSTIPSGMQTLLDLHNEARCTHNASPLTYSDEVASTAQAYADILTNDGNCGKIFHSTKAQRNGCGENLYMCWGTSECYTPENAMKKLYDSEVETSSVSTYGGHATQILWKSASELGCAVSKCSANMFNYTVLVCHYDPPGNYMNDLQQEVELPSGASC